MKMTLEDAKYCLENGGFCSASCKHFSERKTNCEDIVREIAISAINYMIVGQKLSSELEGKER